MAKEDATLQRLLFHSFFWGFTSITLLFFFKKLHTILLIWAFKCMMFCHHRKLRKRKDELFTKSLRMLSEKKEHGGRLRILELGVGAGMNLECYPEGTDLTAVEPFKEIHSAFLKSVDKADNVKLNLLLSHGAESLKELKDNSYDAVVTTFVLCSVKDIQLVFSEVHRVLKPGGNFIFMEHVLAQNRWIRFFQYLVTPITFFLCGGCWPICQPHKLLDTRNFSLEISNEFLVPMKKLIHVITSPHVEVLAVKK